MHFFLYAWEITSCVGKQQRFFLSWTHGWIHVWSNTNSWCLCFWLHSTHFTCHLLLSFILCVITVFLWWPYFKREYYLMIFTSSLHSCKANHKSGISKHYFYLLLSDLMVESKLSACGCQTVMNKNKRWIHREYYEQIHKKEIHIID